MYVGFFKRIIDFLLSLTAILILLPLLAVLTAVGALTMKGNPFFTQKRPGKHGKIFLLIKFRTMSFARDGQGNLLPDDLRVNGYGRFLRSTSLDELPELFNILVGDMAIVGPRPLLVDYLPYYTEEESHRHDVRPGLTGLAQVNGRNAISSWEERFAYDLDYVRRCSFGLDVSIIFKTVGKVLTRADVETQAGEKITVARLDEARKNRADGDTVTRV